MQPDKQSPKNKAHLKLLDLKSKDTVLINDSLDSNSLHPESLLMSKVESPNPKISEIASVKKLLKDKS